MTSPLSLVCMQLGIGSTRKNKGMPSFLGIPGRYLSYRLVISKIRNFKVQWEQRRPSGPQILKIPAIDDSFLLCKHTHISPCRLHPRLRGCRHLPGCDKSKIMAGAMPHKWLQLGIALAQSATQIPSSNNSSLTSARQWKYAQRLTPRCPKT